MRSTAMKFRTMVCYKQTIVSPSFFSSSTDTQHRHQFLKGITISVVRSRYLHTGTNKAKKIFAAKGQEALRPRLSPYHHLSLADNSHPWSTLSRTSTFQKTRVGIFSSSQHATLHSCSSSHTLTFSSYWCVTLISSFAQYLPGGPLKKTLLL